MGKLDRIGESGGFSRPMRIRDSETGKVIRDDSEMMNTIKISVALGGNRPDPKMVASESAKWIDKFCIKINCKECHRQNEIVCTSLYMGYYRKPRDSSGFDKELDVVDWWRCQSCQAANDILDLPEDEKEKNRLIDLIQELDKEDMKVASGLINEKERFFKKDKGV